MFEVIRVGTNYGVVIAVTPPGALPSNLGVKCYIRQDWQVHNAPANVFREITTSEAQMGFSGQTDGWGFERLPVQTFDTLDDIVQWIEQMRKRSA